MTAVTVHGWLATGLDGYRIIYGPDDYPTYDEGPLPPDYDAFDFYATLPTDTNIIIGNWDTQSGNEWCAKSFGIALDFGGGDVQIVSYTSTYCYDYGSVTGLATPSWSPSEYPNAVLSTIVMKSYLEGGSYFKDPNRFNGTRSITFSLEPLSSSSSSSSVSSVSSSSVSSSSFSSSSFSSSSFSSASSLSSPSTLTSESSDSSASSLSTKSSQSSQSSVSSFSSPSSSKSSSSSSVWKGIVFEPAGQNYAVPSLTVDIANRSELVTSTKAAFGTEFRSTLGWVTEERLRGDMMAGEAEWNFTCANGKASSAVALTGETLAIYVATRGHGVGYLGSTEDGPIFSKTIIRISLLDTMRGEEKSVDFDGFSKSLSHPSRTILWKVDQTGEWSEKSRTTSGICGRYVLTITDVSEFYRNPDWTDRVSLPDGMAFPSSESRMQVLAYDWRDVVGRVQIQPSSNTVMLAGVDFHTASIDPETVLSEAQVFDSATVFPAYDVADLTDEQKSVVIHDNAMVVLSSQGPILPADDPDAAVLGISMIAAPVSLDRRVLTVARPAAMLPGPKEEARIFSMSGKTVASNLLGDLTAIVSDRDQGDFKFPDPVRVLSESHGVEWAVSGSQCRWMKVITGASYRTGVILGNEGYELETGADYVSSSSSEMMSSSNSSVGDGD